MTRSRIAAIGVALGGATLLATERQYGYRTMMSRIGLTSQRTVERVVKSLQSSVEKTLTTTLQRAGISWTNLNLAFVALKEERVLELWGRNGNGRWRLIKSYQVLAASGGPGPKLQEGDRQVPEGIYKVDGLNPNSSYHLSIKVDYPNTEDRDLGRAEGRRNLGGDIFIHGSSVSIGCIAIGDEAIEEAFFLAAKARRPIPVLIAPRDFRRAPPTTADAAQGPPWLAARYKALTTAMGPFKT